ncbi:MAG: hypothetical protein ACE14L_02405 [Terriglobales bacterium]
MKRASLAVAGLLLLGLSLPLYAGEPSMTLEQLVQKHLASIGAPEARAAVKTRVAQGTSKWEVLSGGVGNVEGKATLVSEGRKVREVLRFSANDYRGEDLISDGEKLHVSKGLTTNLAPNDPKRSLLGEFLYNEAALLREGIFTGTLGTAWPLLDAKYGSAKLSYEGVKKIDGRELHEVKFVPKKRSDADIHLYFDQDFRHVLTVATMMIDPRILSGGLIQTVRQQPIRYRLEERFEDFQMVDGLTLPTTSEVKFSAEGYASSLMRYTTHFTNIQHNLNLDPSTFRIK